MKLDLHKNLTALVTVDGKTITTFSTSMVYGKPEGDNDLYIYIKDSNTNKDIKIHIKEYAKEVEEISEESEEIEDI
jgi:hypothetical protein